jgi:hypothetical protein
MATYLGPTVLGFAGWMQAQSSRKGLDRVLFLSRDGWLPNQAYQAICKARGRPSNARYVWASRRMLSCTRLETDADIVAYKPHFTRHTTLAEYADILGLAEQDIAHRFQRVHEPVWPSGNPADYEAVRERLAGQFVELAPLILQRAAEQRVLLGRYYAAASDVSEARGIGIVDLGWSGRLMAPLEKLLRAGNARITLSAHFFGTGSAARTIIPDTIPWSSYFFHAQDPRQLASPMEPPDARVFQDVIGASMSLVEILISANYTTIIGLAHDREGGVLPVHAEDTSTAKQRSFLAQAHESCLTFVQDMLRCLPEDPERWDLRDAIAKGWARLLQSPSIAEAELLGRFPHRMDASGHGATKTLVSPADPSSSGENLWDEWSSSLWPAGWFALLEPSLRARMLQARR